MQCAAPIRIALIIFATEKGDAMKRILVPINGSDDSLQAVKEAIRQGYPPRRAEIHLLNVQRRMLPEETLHLTPTENIDIYYYERSHMALAPAEKLLRDAGFPFISHRAVERAVEVILEQARELKCDSIVMSTQGPGRSTDTSSYSVSAKVQQMAQVPVTLVKNTAALI